MEVAFISVRSPRSKVLVLPCVMHAKTILWLGIIQGRALDRPTDAVHTHNTYLQEDGGSGGEPASEFEMRGGCDVGLDRARRRRRVQSAHRRQRVDDTCMRACTVPYHAPTDRHTVDHQARKVLYCIRYCVSRYSRESRSIPDCGRNGHVVYLSACLPACLPVQR